MFNSKKAIEFRIIAIGIITVVIILLVVANAGQIVAKSTGELGKLVPKAPVDTDGDGIVDDQDKFPNDPCCWLDSDGDGLPDEVHGVSTSVPPLVQDTDNDNDGIPDVVEEQLGTNPLDKYDVPCKDSDDGVFDLSKGWDPNQAITSAYKQFIKLGNCTDRTRLYSDSCLPNGKLDEFFCQSTGTCAISEVNCADKLGAGAVCDGGVCKVSCDAACKAAAGKCYFGYALSSDTCSSWAGSGSIKLDDLGVSSSITSDYQSGNTCCCLPFMSVPALGQYACTDTDYTHWLLFTANILKEQPVVIWDAAKDTGMCCYGEAPNYDSASGFCYPNGYDTFKCVAHDKSLPITTAADTYSASRSYNGGTCGTVATDEGSCDWFGNCDWTYQVVKDLRCNTGDKCVSHKNAECSGGGPLNHVYDADLCTVKQGSGTCCPADKPVLTGGKCCPDGHEYNKDTNKCYPI